MLEFDAAHCPFCGLDVVAAVDICEHLIADYGDGSNSDEGILCGSGGSRSGNDALNCLETLRGALLEFARLFADPTEVETYEAEVDRDSVLQATCPGGPVPLWLDSMLEYFSGGSAIHWAVGQIFDQSVAWGASLVETQSIIGTMASTTGTFIWAQTPANGARQIQDTILPITEQVVEATRRVGNVGLKP